VAPFLRWRRHLRLLQQLGQGDAERLGDHSQVQDRDVPFAPFHGADEGPMQFATIAQLLLRQRSFFPLRPDPLAERAEELFVVEARHS
jgi:hypothetical protein